MISIRKSFSTKLTITIMLLAVPIFVISLGFLYTQSRRMIRNEAVGRAKTEDPNKYAEAYDAILGDMRAQIAEIAQGGEE